MLVWGIASFPLYLSMFSAVPLIVPYAVAFGRTTVDAYLAGTIGTYDAYRFIQADSSVARPRTLAITVDSGRFYAPGDLITNHYPPVWLALFQSEAEGALSELRAIGLSYLVVDKRGPIPLYPDRFLTQDAFLDSSMELRFAEHNVLVYRLPEIGATITPRTIQNILHDSSFEAKRSSGKNAPRPAWTTIRGAEIRRSAPIDRDGVGVAWIPHDGGVDQIVGGIVPGQIYALCQALFGGTDGSYARMQIDWMDASKSTISVSQNYIKLDSTWREDRLLDTAPAGATEVNIYITAQVGEIWVDDVAFGPFE